MESRTRRKIDDKRQGQGDREIETDGGQAEGKVTEVATWERFNDKLVQKVMELAT